MMREAGLNLVRIGEFAWADLEPQEGRFSTAWLGRVLDACHASGMAVMLCTPTATSSRWLTRDHPECLRLDRDGRAFVHGSRQHASHVSARYRDFCRRITTVLAEAFGRHPAVVACLRTRWMQDLDGAPGSILGLEVTLHGRGFALEARDPACEVLGRITGGSSAGLAFAVARSRGRGRIVVLAQPARLAGAEAYGRIVALLLDGLGLPRTASSPGVAVFLRAGAWLVVDYAGAGGWVDLPLAGTDLLTGQPCPAGRHPLPPHGVMLVTQPGPT